MRYSRATYAVILLGSSVWCLALFVGPLGTVIPTVTSAISPFVHELFSTICHQFDDRSYHLFGEPLAVCARCSSIYLGFLAGTVLFPFFARFHRGEAPPLVLLYVAVVPMVFDVGLNLIGVNDSSILTRTITGGFFGVIMPGFIVPTMIRAVDELLSTPSSIHIQKGYPHA